MSSFNFSKLEEILTKENPYILIIGMINSGKSTIVKKIHEYNKYPATVVISRKEKLNFFYRDFIDKKYIYNEYDVSIINKVLERQKLLISENKNSKTELIIDDSLSVRGSWIHNEDMKELFYNKEHYKLTTIITFTISMGIPIEMRNKFDYVFIIDFHILTSKILYKHYGYLIFNTFEEFDSLLKNLVKNNHYNYLVLDLINKAFFVYNSYYISQNNASHKVLS